MKHNLTGYVRHKCRCDICKAAKKAAQQRDYAKHRDSILAKNKASQKADRAAANARYRRWKENHPEKATLMGRKYAKAWAKRNPDKVAAKQRQWLEANPNYHREWKQRRYLIDPYPFREAAKVRRAREMGAEMREVTRDQWDRLCLQYDNRCAYCRSAGPLQKDHVIPLTRGGRHSIGNLLPACKPCNSSKNRKLLVEWRYRRARGLRQPTALSRQAS